MYTVVNIPADIIGARSHLFRFRVTIKPLSGDHCKYNRKDNGTGGECLITHISITVNLSNDEVSGAHYLERLTHSDSIWLPLILFTHKSISLHILN